MKGSPPPDAVPASRSLRKAVASLICGQLEFVHQGSRVSERLSPLIQAFEDYDGK